MNSSVGSHAAVRYPVPQFVHIVFQASQVDWQKVGTSWQKGGQTILPKEVVQEKHREFTMVKSGETKKNNHLKQTNIPRNLTHRTH